MSESIWKKRPWKKNFEMRQSESQVGWALVRGFERWSGTGNICRFMNSFYHSGAVAGVELEDFRYL